MGPLFNPITWMLLCSTIVVIVGLPLFALGVYRTTRSQGQKLIEPGFISFIVASIVANIIMLVILCIWLDIAQ